MIIDMLPGSEDDSLGPRYRYIFKYEGSEYSYHYWKEVLSCLNRISPDDHVFLGEVRAFNEMLSVPQDHFGKVIGDINTSGDLDWWVNFYAIGRRKLSREQCGIVIRKVKMARF